MTLLKALIYALYFITLWIVFAILVAMFSIFMFTLIVTVLGWM